MNDDAVAVLASELAGEPVESLERIGGGGNNRIYRVVCPSGRFALKRYPDDPAEARERWYREFVSLTFLWSHGERAIPEPISVDPERRAALYTWVDGARIAEPMAADADALVAFARRLHALRGEERAVEWLPPAKEAVFSQGALVGQIEGRLARLEELDDPALAPILREARRIVAQAPSDAGAEALDTEYSTLSPSDFGFHNALRTAGGPVFLDFEYFGWDDPVKLVADVLWHPGMALPDPLRSKIFAGLADAYSVDPGFRARFDRDAPLYGVRWALIVLGEFLPDVWARRVAAGHPDDRAAARERQLAKAERLLERAARGAVIA